MEVTVDVKNAQATEETRRSDMVAEGMMEVHTAHATSTPVMEPPVDTFHHKQAFSEKMKELRVPDGVFSLYA